MSDNNDYQLLNEKARLLHLEAKYKQKFTLYVIGDLHLGSVYCDKGILRSIIAEIKENPDARWIGLGDLTEAISIKDSRFEDVVMSEGNRQTLVGLQVKELAGLLKPIADKCIGLIAGNHEQKVRGQTALLCLMGLLCDYANINQNLVLGSAGWIRLTFSLHHKRHKVDIYAVHGWGGARKLSSKAGKLSDLAASCLADIIILAHDHHYIETVQGITYIDDRGNLRVHTPRLIMIDSVRINPTQGFDYSAAKGFPAHKPVVKKIHIVPFVKLKGKIIKQIWTEG